MRTKEEVVKHLAENGYTPIARGRICSFLVGADIKDFDEELLIMVGKNHWEDFYEWWENEEDCDDCMFEGLMKYLCEQHNKSNDDAERDKITGYIEWLLECFDEGEVENG